MAVIRWAIRGACGACGALLWTDAPVKTVCACDASWVLADGSLGGHASELTDEEFVAALEADGVDSPEPEQVS